MKKYLLFLTMIFITYCTMDAKKVFVPSNNQELDIPFTEDLMKEHGLLNRALLLYEKISKTLDTKFHNVLPALHEVATIVDEFIHEYHEKLEENYIFPIFEEHQKELKLISTLKKQHIKGKIVTKKLQELATLNTLSPQDIALIKKLIKKFITMYRPHEAWEDTVLFPQVRGLISTQKFDQLSELFEDTEHELFGEDGFENILHKIEQLEKELRIYELDQFTPNVE